MTSQRLTILHTADFHGSLTLEKAERLREMKEDYGDCLLLDSGDALRSGNVMVPLRPEPTPELMNLAGYDAMCLGNREYFFRRSGLLRKTRAAEFAVMAANLAAKRGDMGHIAQQKVFLVGEARIGVFGLAREMIGPDSFWDRFSDMVFLDPEETIESTTADLRRHADLLVLLSHLGLETDRALARRGYRIDLILGGHDHAKVSFDSTQDDPPFLSHPGAYGEGVAVLHLDIDSGAITAGRSEIVPL
jgi:2',3'-cyclic-nucleotide 2'-phosphodiesterase (5'-nucleotidase family)